ncbi:PACE efflux transporter [Paucibacter sp. AS339]|uniref:PACE efflux transporter n=1 Tax=Paucibacter hankyongi TaxID=3133434 RepID=UPI0030A1586E
MSAPVEHLSHTEQVVQVVLKEVLALVLVAPLAAWILNTSAHTMLGLAVLFSVMAVSLEYCINRAYYFVLIRYSLSKTKLIRALHAIAIEVGLAAMTVPIIMWQLDMSFVDALFVDIGLAAFYWVWTYAFYWAYDHLRPKLGLSKPSA